MSTFLDAAAAATDNDPIDSPDFQLPNAIATRRLRVLLETWAAQGGYDLDEMNSGAKLYLSDRSGLAERRVYAILKEEGPTVTFNTLENIINHSGELELRWTPKEDGGFADVFNGEPQEIPEMTPEQEAFAEKGRKQRRERMARHRREQEKARQAWAREELAGVA